MGSLRQQREKGQFNVVGAVVLLSESHVSRNSNTHFPCQERKGGGGLGGGGGGGSGGLGDVSVHRGFGEQSGATTGRKAFLKASERNRTWLHCAANHTTDCVGAVLHSRGGKHTFAQVLRIENVCLKM